MYDRYSPPLTPFPRALDTATMSSASQVQQSEGGVYYSHTYTLTVKPTLLLRFVSSLVRSTRGNQQQVFSFAFSSLSCATCSESRPSLLHRRVSLLLLVPRVSTESGGRLKILIDIVGGAVRSDYSFLLAGIAQVRRYLAVSGRAVCRGFGDTGLCPSAVCVFFGRRVVNATTGHVEECDCERISSCSKSPGLCWHAASWTLSSVGLE